MKRSLLSETIKSNVFEKYRRGAFLAIFVLPFMVILAVSARAQSSSYAGSYSGEWVAKFYSGEQHEGTWDISIASDGKVTGVEFDKTSGTKGTISGFIDEDGYIKIFVRYSNSVSINGVLEKKGTRLIGTLKQLCNYGSNNTICATIDIILNAQNKSTSGISNGEQTTQRGIVTQDCLNAVVKTKGTLIIKMKDGSKKIIDLSEAEAIMVVP
jgi:hypothetical protein